MGSKVGLQLKDSIPILPSHWKGYEFKRHQCGKSFQARIEDFNHYSFQSIDVVEGGKNILREMFDSVPIVIAPIVKIERIKNLKRNESFMN